MNNHFKVGIGSYAYRWTVSLKGMTASQMLEQAAAVGCEVVQLCDNLGIAQFPRTELQALARQAAGLGLELEVGIKGGQLDQLRQGLDAAEALGTRLLRVVVADDAFTPSAAELTVILKKLLPDLQARGISLAVENHFDLTPDELGQVVEEINSPLVGVCLDPINAISQLIGQKEVVSRLARHTLSAHVKDAQAVSFRNGFYVSGVPLGTGRLNLPEMLAALRAEGRYPAVLLESWMDRLDSDEATCAQEEEWVRNAVAYMRQVVKEIA